jgi:hypothetical protein
MQIILNLRIQNGVLYKKELNGDRASFFPFAKYGINNVESVRPIAVKSSRYGTRGLMDISYY